MIQKDLNPESEKRWCNITLCISSVKYIQYFKLWILILASANFKDTQNILFHDKFYENIGKYIHLNVYINQLCVSADIQPWKIAS